MPGRKRNYRKTRARKRKVQKAEEERRKGLGCTKCVLEDSLYESHPLNSWPTVIVLLILEFKEELDSFKKRRDEETELIHGFLWKFVFLEKIFEIPDSDVKVGLGEGLERVFNLLVESRSFGEKLFVKFCTDEDVMVVHNCEEVYGRALGEIQAVVHEGHFKFLEDRLKCLQQLPLPPHKLCQVKFFRMLEVIDYLTTDLTIYEIFHNYE